MAIAALLVQADSYEFALEPRVGDARAQRFDVTVELELESWDLWMKGGGDDIVCPMPASARARDRLVAAFTDEIVGIDEGRATDRLRSYQAASLHRERERSGTDDDFSRTDEVVAPVAERTVRFLWNSELEEYAAAAVDDASISADSLRELRADIDLTSFVPPRAVAVGDQWRVDAIALMELYDPSGAFGFVADAGGDASARAIDPQLLRSTTDELRCELVAVRESDGGDLAILSITGDVRCRRKEIGEVSVLVPLAGRLSGHGPSSSSLLLSVEGTLEWNLRAQRLASAEVNAELHLERERSICVRGLHPVDVGESEAWSGELNVRVNCEPRSKR